MSDKSNNTGGIGLGGGLLLLFIGLKLGGVIDWSWWWVMSPIWIPLLIVVAFASLAAIFSR